MQLRQRKGKFCSGYVSVASVDDDDSVMAKKVVSKPAEDSSLQQNTICFSQL